MRIFNTLTNSLEQFLPSDAHQVTFYTCGPTVYDYTHIGHIRTFIGNDVLKRSLQYLGYQVKHVMNITDVGHLSSDADEGEDKLEKGAKKEGKSVWEVAGFYTDHFFKTMKAVNVLPADIVSKATDHIPQMISLIQQLETKGYTYETDEAVYFDVLKFERYGSLSKQKIEEKIKGARNEVKIDPVKHHPADFALWFKRVGRFADHAMHWDSPWGDGFPGWHIECSAMAMHYLGETIDIHTGGIDHIPVHHENEIAQSEAASGKPFVRIWLHHNFLLVEGQKMSKSLQNFYTLEDIVKTGIEPEALRLLFLQTHYSQPMNFTRESARAAQEAYTNLKARMLDLQTAPSRVSLSEEKLSSITSYQEKFRQALENNLQIPAAVAVLWEALKSNIPSEDKLDLAYEFDQVLGLSLRDISSEPPPQDVMDLAEARAQARADRQFDRSDQLRKKIQEKGYDIEDTSDGFRLKRRI